MGGESKNLGASFKPQDLHDISYSEAPGTQTSTPRHHRESTGGAKWALLRSRLTCRLQPISAQDKGKGL